MDLLLERQIDDLDSRCNKTLPDGLSIVEWAQVDDDVPKLSADIRAARYVVAVDECNLRTGENPEWDDFKRGAGAGSTITVDTGLLQALKDELCEQFGTESANADPSLLDINITTKDGELRIEYLSTMKQGKSLFPEMLEQYIGESLGMNVPMHVVRKALLVERDGALHSPISKGVVQNLL